MLDNVHEIVNPSEAEAFSDIYVYNDGHQRSIPISFFNRKYSVVIPSYMNRVEMDDLMVIFFSFPHERISRNLVLPSLRAGDVFIDCGAGYGSWALPAACMGAHVHAFEPDTRSNKILHTQIDFNKLLVTTHKIYLDDECTLDSYRFIPDVIKIDVEGDEFKVLAGARKTIKKYKPRLLVEVHTFKHGREPVEEIEMVRKLNPEYRSVVIRQNYKADKDVYYHVYNY